MMKSMIAENGLTFKELERKIYSWICQIGRDFTKEFLERYDRMLMEERVLVEEHKKGHIHGKKEVPVLFEEADGASWIKQVKDKSTCFQLDPFHRNKAVKEKIHNRKAVRDIMELLEAERIEEVFEYLEIYKNSLGDDAEIEDAEELIRYYENNREGLRPYQSQGLELPEHPEGLEYRNMGRF